MRDDFAVFITSHERAKKLKTLETLIKKRYSGKYFIVIDEMDNQKEEYKKRYKENLLIFDKKEIAGEADFFQNKENFKCVLYARRFVEKEAKKMKLSSFAVCDDDFSNFVMRYIERGKLKSDNIDDFSEVLAIYRDFVLENNVCVAGFGLDGSYIGGARTFVKKNGRRRCFGFFVRNAKIPFEWVSDINEDYISCVIQGKEGKIVLEFSDVQAIAKNTGKGIENGGMKETYKATSEYERAFKGVIASPSCFKVGERKGKLNIVFEEGKGVPCIVSGRWKK